MHKTSFNDWSDPFLKLRLLDVVVPADAHEPPPPKVEAPKVEAAGEKKPAEAQKRDGGGETAAEKAAAEALRTTVTDAKAAAATKAAATAETAAEARDVLRVCAVGLWLWLAEAFGAVRAAVAVSRS